MSTPGSPSVCNISETRVMLSSCVMLLVHRSRATWAQLQGLEPNSCREAFPLRSESCQPPSSLLSVVATSCAAIGQADTNDQDPDGDSKKVQRTLQPCSGSLQGADDQRFF